ncbi:MAG: phosphoribosylformimino-5-aminoimidazole carboxamide ribotide isomerase [Acidimicrobiaceae bacterium]|jgi:phosphoribosylformimino-5-aminoimidazole carboxamide ribotide isomerase|nr:phosphoribosylformimino-5-aminoimidazole carboxamide ribotide isomerase [Acidimicrobiaceae bacterium]MDQ1445227.1 phosphoribosylformimino-5-aminoimidazole carboxamide ribotide isomerase [Acidimicrobiaceae bacterium]
MELFPAIDLRDGKCVRLKQGDYSQETVYGGDPVAMAQEFEEDGARWIHVVDLDAARTGRPENRDVVAEIAGGVGVPVQSGGGIRDEFSAEALLERGIARIVIGTAAVEQPRLVRRLASRHPGRIAVGLDARHGEAAVRGWTEGSGVTVLEAIAWFDDAGVAAFIVTDIARDGMLTGPDVEGLAGVLGATRAEVVASGGVGSLDDLRALAALEVSGRRLAGVIVGKAIYEGVFTVSEALKALA